MYDLLWFWLWASLASVNHSSVERTLISLALEELKVFQHLILAYSENIATFHWLQNVMSIVTV